MEEEKKAPEPDYARKFTLDGEVLVKIIRAPTQAEPKGDYVEYPLKTVELMPLPDGFKEAHVIEMKLFHSLLRTIRKQYPKRVVPITRKEILRSGADSKLLRQLVEFGMLVENYVPILNARGENSGSRACLYYTPQGRALIRAKLDPSYAKTDYQ